MTLKEKMESYKSGDKTHSVELLVRTQRAMSFVAKAIEETEGGWGSVKEDDKIKTAQELCELIMGETNFKHFVLTHSIIKDLL
jgi:hypothetical protein